MKRIFFAFVILLLLISAIACAAPQGNIGTEDGGTSGMPETTEPAQTAQEKGEGFVFAVASAQGLEISVDMDMKDILSALGEPLKLVESPSCAFEGLDKTYTYSGFQITTRPEGECDFVNLIVLTDDSVTTPEGVYIGADAESVKDIYGTPESETENLLSYKKGDTQLNFLLKNAEVVSIEYWGNS